jgi:hypothetical protein
VKIVGRFGLALENIFVIRKRCHDPTEATVDGSAPRSVIFLCHAYAYLMCLIAMFIEIWSCPKSGRFTALTYGPRDQLYMQSKVLIGVHIGEGIKVCQTAGRSIGKVWQRVKGEPRGALCRKFACCLCVCVSWADLAN